MTAVETGAIFIKRLIFLFLRIRQDIVLYEGVPHESGQVLRLVHIGEANRGRAFIEGLFGHVPQRKAIGRAFCWSWPRRLPPAALPCDLLLVETNRLRAGHFRRAGFFMVPEWVEFGRQVVADLASRYRGASKSLKSDLNKILSSRFSVAVTRDARDFEAFYDEMYLPHARQRFGEAVIIKGKRSLRKDFHAGFLLLLKDGDKAIAGALVREEGSVITETTLGVLAGADAFLRMGVSGAIDYHLLDWAATHNKTFLKVGHTRPFPRDGVYRNKRKWLMAVSPDLDGVMDMAVQIRRFDRVMATIFRACPFVFQTPRGLAIFCGHDGPLPAGKEEIDELVQSHAVEGLRDLIIASATGFREDARPIRDEKNLPAVYLFAGVDAVVAWQNGLAP